MPDDERDRRQEVHVAMRVPGERRNAPGARSLGLRSQLLRQLRRAHSAREETKREDGKRVEPSVLVAERGDRGGVARGLAADEVEMQSDFEVALGLRERRGLLGGRVRHDERGRADHAATMSFEDAARHAGAEAEIVGGHDDAQR